jgi:hypothetical protein
MPRLINIGVGEIADRLTILSLKILYGRQQGKLIDHFETERNALLTQLRGRELNGAWFEQVLGLGAVNGALWQAEDELRDWRKRFELKAVSEVEEPAACHLVALVAFRIQTLNDERAGLIEAINKLTGDHLGREKLND